MRAAWLALALFPLAACGKMDPAAGGDEDVQAESAALSGEASNVEASVQAIATDSLLPADAQSGESAAKAAAAKAGALLQPHGCETVNVAGNKVTYGLTNCTGPYGLLRASGIITATFLPAAGGVKVQVTSTDLQVNQTNVTLDFTAVVTGLGGATRSATVESKSIAASARRTIVHAGAYTATWDGTCVTLTGSFTTTVGAASYTTTFADYKRCRSACPTGSITFTGPKGTLSIAYSGGPSAAWTSGARSGTVPLLCSQS